MILNGLAVAQANSSVPRFRSIGASPSYGVVKLPRAF